MTPLPSLPTGKGPALLAALLLAGGSLFSCRGPEIVSSDRKRTALERDPRRLEELVRRLAASPDPADRAEALWAVHDHRGRIALSAVEGLARSGDARLLPHLFDRIRDGEAPENLRLACLDALFSFPSSLWRARLAALLPEIDSPQVRAAAEEILASLPPKEDGRGALR